MNALLGILALVLALAIHEAGHAVAMMRRGIEIEQAGIGFPIGRRLQLTLRPRFLSFPIIITPLLIGAFVQPSQQGQAKLEAMGFRDKATCYAAGVISNVVSAGVVMSVLFIFRLIRFGGSLVPLAVALGLTVLFVVGRHAIAMVSPVIGLVAMCYVVYQIFLVPDAIGGPVGVFRTVTSASSGIEVVLIGVFMSVNLALLNMFPLVPLDGGRVAYAFFTSRGWAQVGKAYMVASVVGFIAFIGYAIVSDFI